MLTWLSFRILSPWDWAVNKFVTKLSLKIPPCTILWNYSHLLVSQARTETVVQYFCTTCSPLSFVNVHLHMCILYGETLLFWLGSSFSSERQEDAGQHGWKISLNEGLKGNTFILAKVVIRQTESNNHLQLLNSCVSILCSRELTASHN